MSDPATDTPDPTATPPASNTPAAADDPPFDPGVARPPGVPRSAAESVALFAALGGLAILALCTALIMAEKEWDEARRVMSASHEAIAKRFLDAYERWKAGHDRKVAGLRNDIDSFRTKMADPAAVEAMQLNVTPDEHLAGLQRELGDLQKQTFQGPPDGRVRNGQSPVIALELFREGLRWFHRGDFVFREYVPASSDEAHPDATGRNWYIEVRISQEEADRRAADDTAPSSRAGWARIYGDGTWTGPWPADHEPGDTDPAFYQPPDPDAPDMPVGLPGPQYPGRPGLPPDPGRVPPGN